MAGDCSLDSHHAVSNPVVQQQPPPRPGRQTGGMVQVDIIKKTSNVINVATKNHYFGCWESLFFTGVWVAWKYQDITLRYYAQNLVRCTFSEETMKQHGGENGKMYRNARENTDAFKIRTHHFCKKVSNSLRGLCVINSKPMTRKQSAVWVRKNTCKPAHRVETNVSWHLVRGRILLNITHRLNEPDFLHHTIVAIFLHLQWSRCTIVHVDCLGK